MYPKFNNTKSLRENLRQFRIIVEQGCYKVKVLVGNKAMFSEFESTFLVVI